MCLAIPGRIAQITDPSEITRRGIVDFDGIRKTVNLAFVPEAKEHDYVLVHVGFAISRIDEAKARLVFESLRQLEALDELEPSPVSDPEPELETEAR